MKPMVGTLIGAVLLLGASSQGFASMEIEQVTKPRAKQLGLALQAKPNGPSQVVIELEFKAEGELKDFDSVSLEIRDGDKLLLGYALLKEKRPGMGTTKVSFMADRGYVDKILLTVIAGQPMNYRGYEVRVKDFVDADKAR